jgi:hypothetical protein
MMSELLQGKLKPSTTILLLIMAHLKLFNQIRPATVMVYGLVSSKLVTNRGIFQKTCCTGTRFPSFIQHRPISRSATVQMMAIVDDVTADMKTAMRAKDAMKLGTIRLIRTAFANAAIELRTESLSDEQVSEPNFRNTYFALIIFIFAHIENAFKLFIFNYV